MFLLVTGASGAGKSTARLAVTPVLSPDVECVELHDIIDVPARPTLAWRQQATEVAVQRALALQDEHRHLLLSGDPVAAGEVLAAPSAVYLHGVAACLLDVSPGVQSARLNRRGDAPALMADHHAPDARSDSLGDNVA
jgi:ABC-type multidrug transport system fused ATPase/permease subunit